MASFCKISACSKAGGTAANANYILREKACDLWETRHVPDHEILGNTVREQKLDLAHRFGDLAEQGRGSRHSYRVILSFEQKITSEKALTMAREFLDKSHFKDNQAILAVHKNTDHTHVHIAVLARNIEGKKLDLNFDKYKTIPKVWDKIYQRELTREKTTEPSREKAIDKQREAVAEREIKLEEWRRRYGELRRQGLEPQQIKGIIGNRPGPEKSPSVHQVHIRENEHEKGRIVVNLQGTRELNRGIKDDLGRAAGLDRELGKDRPGAERGPRLIQGGERGLEGRERPSVERERTLEPSPQGARTIGRAIQSLDHDEAGRFVGTILQAAQRFGEGREGNQRGVEKSGGKIEVFRSRVSDFNRQAEQRSPGFVRERVRNHAQELVREHRGGVEKAGGKIEGFRSRVVEFKRQVEQRAPGVGRERVRDHAQQLSRGFLQRLREVSSRLNFKENVYPLVRRCELYLRQLPKNLEKVRDHFRETKERIFDKVLGRKLSFEERFELQRKEPPILRQEKLELSRDKDRDGGKELFRTR